MAKSADAFRTISEVADWLGVPAHVLRFWESKFSQVKPVKRAGGRRYYRPADMLLLGGIKKLLHDDGMTIKGVQKVLREQGVKHVSSFSRPLDFEAAEAIEGDAVQPSPAEEAGDDLATVVSFQRDKTDEPEAVAAATDAGHSEPPGSTPEPAATAAEEAEEAEEEETAPEELSVEMAAASDFAAGPEGAPDTVAMQGTPAEDTSVLEDFAAPGMDHDDDTAAVTPQAEGIDDGTGGQPAAAAPAPDSQHPAEDIDADAASATQPGESPEMVSATPEAEPEAETPSGDVALPGFLHRQSESADAGQAEEPAAAAETTPESPPEPEQPILRPEVIDLPQDPRDDEIAAAPGILSTLARRRGRPLGSAATTELAALRSRLADLSAHQGTAGPE